MTVDIDWQKSSFSGNEGPNCVEIAQDGDAILIRESDAPHVILSTTRANLAALIAGVEAGEFDHFVS
jgi:hypothetical protein